MATGLLVVDVQPAYAAGCDFIAAKVAQRINNTVKPVTIMWVGDGLSSDSEESVRDYLREYGARPGRLAEANFVEKGYAFFRGWMDQGVDAADIIKVGRSMLDNGLHCSDAVDLEQLYGDDIPDFPEIDHLHHPQFDDSRLRKLSSVETCGGGSNECLAEIELWLQMTRMPFKRLDSLVYG
jgi:hypothetical protein